MIAALLCLVMGAQGLELKGAVTAAEGRAVTGASVYIAAARPRRGVGVL